MDSKSGHGPLIITAGAVVAGLLVIAAVAAALLRGEPAGSGSPGESASLGERVTRSGTVEVTMTALALAESGARFRIEFDTHSGELDLDVAGNSVLTVDGAAFGPGTWAGAGPGGHHREGTLSFSEPVPGGAAVVLRISGLGPDAAIGTWTAP